jgi:hypothetical protein
MLGLRGMGFEALFFEPGFLFGGVEFAVFDTAPALLILCHLARDRPRLRQRQVIEEEMAGVTGFEPVALGFGDRCSTS